MRQVPNDIISTLQRTLPIILGNLDEEAMKKNLRLYNAVRLTNKILKRLNKIENEQRNQNQERELAGTV